jgi:5-methylcytosine-specific restriction endonuclease McrBC regulatory subunit McrC
MATWTGQEHAAQVFKAAEVWKLRCLIEDQSLFSNSSLWTRLNFEELKRLFVDNPILGSRKFYDKLQEQIGSAKPDTCKLAAESLWLLYLFVSNSVMGVDRKRERIAEVWKWSKEPFPDSELLQDDKLKGLANPGIAFLTKVWAEYGFLITLMLAWKSLSSDDRAKFLANDPWGLCEWVTKIEGADVRAFRHIFLCLCYPDQFERICSRNHKKQIYARLSPRLEVRLVPYRTSQTLCALDRSIFEIRKLLETEYNTSKIDFYQPPLRELWREDEEEEDLDDAADISQKVLEHNIAPQGPRYWVEKTNVQGRVDRQDGPNRVGVALWSPQQSKDGRDIYSNMRKVLPGDFVFHLTDNVGFTGISSVQNRVDDTFSGVPGTTWGIQPSYRVALKDYRQLDPPLLREAFFGDQELRRDLLATLQSGTDRGPLFYNKALELNQGAYLTELPSELIQLLNRAYEKSVGKPLPISLSLKLLEMPATYTPEDAAEDLFFDITDIEQILAVWKAKKNAILQGPPGVGKSFAARRLAYALMQAEAPSRVCFIQFHQSYSYEDFVQGFRPTENGFALRTGRFYEFCCQARSHLGERYVFIIDEINRGNLSKIFGEVMLLIEPDKRSPVWEMPLAYSLGNEKFFVPENVFLLGLMNTADRSLAVVDYALRRRFAFFTLDPQFVSEKFVTHLKSLDVSDSLIRQIRQRMGDLNGEIREDQTNLGRGFCIGHSFFCEPRDKSMSEEEWYRQVILTEIVPLLAEYWFDNPNRVTIMARPFVGRVLTMEYAIPIENIYFIFCYAWRRLEEGKVVDVGGVDSPELVDLFAKVMIGGVKHLIRRGIDRGYIPIIEELSTVRGRIHVYESIKPAIHKKPYLVCEFDELSHNVLHNQILKATILRLIGTRGIHSENAHELRLLLEPFGAVSAPLLSKRDFRQVQIHRNNAFYSFLISLCELIHEATLPDEDNGGYRFSDIIRDEKKMPLVFQDFVRNFFAIESDFKVAPLTLRWDAISDDEDDLKMLPTMTTDIHLEKGDRRIIIDTKYYKESLQEHHGKQSIRSGHLYQLFSYLKNAEARHHSYLNAEGILLYPAVGDKLSIKVEIQGHPVQVHSIKLDQPWQMIKNDLLETLRPGEANS